jgi:hypothetical protein
MRTQYVARTRPSHRIKQFIKTSFEPATKQQEVTKPVIQPVSSAKPVAKEPARNLPLFMEPVFKAKDFDPL